VAFAVDGDGVGFATESYAASALYTTLANLSGAFWRIRRAKANDPMNTNAKTMKKKHKTKKSMTKSDDGMAMDGMKKRCQVNSGSRRQRHCRAASR
jgi:hypothetical protein